MTDENAAPAKQGVVRSLIETIGLSLLMALIIPLASPVILVFLGFFLLPLAITPFWDMISMAMASAVFCGIMGHMIPRHEFWRGAFTFIWIVALDYALFSLSGNGFKVDWQKDEPNLIAGYLVGGSLLCAFASSVGGRALRDFEGYIKAHLQEFRESISFSHERQGKADMQGQDHAHQPNDTANPKPNANQQPPSQPGRT